jgi:hypothetical protein
MTLRRSVRRGGQQRRGGRRGHGGGQPSGIQRHRGDGEPGIPSGAGTKDSKTPIVVSHATAAALGDRFQVRELSEFTVKGRQESVRVCAVDVKRGGGGSAGDSASSEGEHG